MDDWDWELLHNSQPPPPPPPQQPPPTTPFSLSSLSDDEKISGVFQSDYFSINQTNPISSGPTSEDDSSSWIDPNITVSGTRTRNSDSSDSSISTDNSDLTGPTSLDLIQSHHSSCEFHGGANGGEGGGDGGGGGGGGGEEEEEEEERGSESEAKEEEEEKEKKEGVAWWRVPMEMVKYCVIKVSPVWSLSMLGAAIMGFLILRRRYLYKIKRKSLGLQLKVTIDDKKESQFMSRVARLNEAFSVVKRVPMIRPSLPAPGLAPWPVMSMR